MNFEVCEAEVLYEFVLEDPARNYFICHTLDAHKTFRGVWRLMDHKQVKMAVFLRHTGLIQAAFAANIKGCGYQETFVRLLKNVKWQQAMVVEAVKKIIVENFENLEVAEGAKIMKCSPELFLSDEAIRVEDLLEIRTLDESDLDAVVMIYQEVFSGFASRAYMAEKFQKRRGRAYGGFINGKLVAVAQSDYETIKDAIVVGVATEKGFQGKGYGKRIFRCLCMQLVNEGKTLYLQYDSIIAGEMYKRFGFEKLDQIYHIKRMAE